MLKKEKWEIIIVDPKVKGLLEELEYLQLIEINKPGIAEIKSAYLEKFKGKNLLDIDSSDLLTE